MRDLDIRSLLDGIINAHNILISSAQEFDKRDSDNGDKLSADTRTDG